MEGSRKLPEETGATRGDRGGTAVRRLGNNPLPPEREETEKDYIREKESKKEREETEKVYKKRGRK